MWRDVVPEAWRTLAELDCIKVAHSYHSGGFLTDQRYAGALLETYADNNTSY